MARLGEKDVGGMNVYVLNVAKQLSCLGHSVDVFTRTHDENDPMIVDLNRNARVIHVKAGAEDADKNDLPRHIDHPFLGCIHWKHPGRLPRINRRCRDTASGNVPRFPSASNESKVLLRRYRCVANSPS